MWEMKKQLDFLGILGILNGNLTFIYTKIIKQATCKLNCIKQRSVGCPLASVFLYNFFYKKLLLILIFFNMRNRAKAQKQQNRVLHNVFSGQKSCPY